MPRRPANGPTTTRRAPVAASDHRSAGSPSMASADQAGRVTTSRTTGAGPLIAGSACVNAFSDARFPWHGAGLPGAPPSPREEPAMTRPPLPPFDHAAAVQKVRLAEDAWNTRDPEKVAGAYTVDSRWRNRDEFVTGRDEIVAFLTRKWERELDYRVGQELWAVDGNRIAVRFAYESHDDSGRWFRSYGNENWEFDENGLMRIRHASINDLPIAEEERLYRWPQGRRPDDHPGLSDLGL